ncbi:DUF397 domain-containing protein [Nocardia amamiensis]|uniref:DUF397 domain-containing protein n=1 Tax=Nocardia amamiensis TaxID=404578 RepID=UPI0008321883|nr:DUF397 domain-containing protein [Nocardia amamiensis]
MATTARPESTGWFTSTRSNNGNQCVEVRFDGDAVLIRDSKYRRNPANRRADEPIITVTEAEWTAFLDVLRTRGRSNGELSAHTAANGHTTLRHGETALTYTAEEWDAFMLGAHDGEFDRIVAFA